jgi:hypothetical protein
MDVKHCKAKEAQGKPFIERLNRSLKEALQRLPGTRYEGKDGMRDPEALGDELMTIDALEKWIVRWLSRTGSILRLTACAGMNYWSIRSKVRRRLSV